MKKVSTLLTALPMLLAMSTANAMGGPPANPFIGMNPFANQGNGMCHLISADGTSVYKGPGDIKVTINNNFAIGTCMVKPDTDGDVKPAFVERADVACHIKSEQSGHYTGTGGFTVTPSGNVIARCKAELAPE
jgi:hypothetical protein